MKMSYKRQINKNLIEKLDKELKKFRNLIIQIKRCINPSDREELIIRLREL